MFGKICGIIAFYFFAKTFLVPVFDTLSAIIGECIMRLIFKCHSRTYCELQEHSMNCDEKKKKHEEQQNKESKRPIGFSSTKIES